MTDAEFTKELREIIETYGNDREALHVEVDALLIRIIKQEGYTKFLEVYNAIKQRFWYA